MDSLGRIIFILTHNNLLIIICILLVILIYKKTKKKKFKSFLLIILIMLILAYGITVIKTINQLRNGEEFIACIETKELDECIKIYEDN